MLTLLTNSLKSSNPHSVTDYLLNIVITPECPEKLENTDQKARLGIFFCSGYYHLIISLEKGFFFDLGVFYKYIFFLSLEEF